MKKALIILFAVFMILLSLDVALSWMPESHAMFLESARSQYPNTPVGKIINQYPDDAIACNILTDISVFYYFSEGFTAIGKEYKATHSTLLCEKMVELAGNDPQKLACAYGVCGHHVQDSVSHNMMVPDTIKRTMIPNGIIHALVEEKINDEIATQELRSRVRNALRNKAPAHKEMFRQALVTVDSDLPFDAMYDKFVYTVVGDAKYGVAFQGFFAIPFSIHVMLILLLTLNIVSLFFLISRGLFGGWSRVLMILNIIMIIVILLAYVLFFTNQLWKFFETFSGLFTVFIPLPNSNEYINQAKSVTNDLFINGAYYVRQIEDPAGVDSLSEADENNTMVRMLFGLVMAAGIGFLAYKGFNTGKRRR
jgi:hypothetical protein